MIYVGTNDGMLHAINDCDGTEAWAFIPPDVLPYLQYLTGNTHSYFTDSTIYSYVFDQNLNGTIEYGAGDKVILFFGLGRGAGVDSAPTTGVYYALDVSNPAAPRYLWKLSNAMAGFSNLGEAWSEPKIVKAKIGTTDKIIMVIGGGYDNCYEDARCGETQTFSGFCVGGIITNDGGLDTNHKPKTSSGLTLVNALSNRKGNGLYIVEIAYLDTNGIPIFSSTGNKIWGSTAFDYSMVTEATALDTNYDGYVDRLYVGDTGGNLWRADLSSTDPTNWNVTRIFSANPGYTNGSADSSEGRKIFYKPSAVVDVNDIVRLYFGTGDREHPLNRAVTDRLYEVIDKGQTTAITEAKLVDVTLDQMQNELSTAASTTIYNTALALASNPSDTTTYGWYIRLDAGDRNPVIDYPGEKVLAPATVFNKRVYYTTYSPNTATVTDPCQAGNLGLALLYKVDYDTGMATDNLDTSNDGDYSIYKNNTFAITEDNKVLRRSDRRVSLGSGIPSGVVVTGEKVFVGCGGGICTSDTTAGGQVFPLYWRQR
jgi:type IV pilus assembly protein PilY1